MKSVLQGATGGKRNDEEVGLVDVKTLDGVPARALNPHLEPDSHRLSLVVNPDQIQRTDARAARPRTMLLRTLALQPSE